MAEVRALAEEERAAQTGGASDLAVRWIRRLIFVGIGLGVFQQFTGINSVMYYGSQLLDAGRLLRRPPRSSRTRSGLFSVVGISVGLLVMNKVDRRTMLLGGFALTTTFHVLVGLSALLMPDDPVKAYVMLVFVVLFVFSMQGTIGPLVWLMLAEIFPLKIRSFAMGVCVFCSGSPTPASRSASRPVVAAIGIAPTFFIFAGLGVLALVFIATSVPETRGARSNSSRTSSASSTAEQVSAGRPHRHPERNPVSVLVAVADSKEGRQALSAAATEAQQLGTDLVVVNLALSALDTTGLPAGVDHEVVERHGRDDADPVEAVLDAARGPAGRHAAGHRPAQAVADRQGGLGSTSQRLLLESPVPVLAVKADQ